jgi:hypothetical protein
MEGHRLPQADRNYDFRLTASATAPSAEETADLMLAVAKHVSTGAALVWLWLWREAGFAGPHVASVNLTEVGLITGNTKMQGKRNIDELVAAGLVTVLHRMEGRGGGLELRIEHAPEVLQPGPAIAHGEAQRPLIGSPDPGEPGFLQPSPDAAQHTAPPEDTAAQPPPNFDPSNVTLNVTENDRFPLRSHHDHGEITISNHDHGHDHVNTNRLTIPHDHDAHERYVSNVTQKRYVSPPNSADLETRRLQAELTARRRAARRPSQASAAPSTIGNITGPLRDALEQAGDPQRYAERHRHICDLIVNGVRDQELPIGFVHDAADIVTTGQIPEPVIHRLVTRLNKHAPDNRGAYFRVSFNRECHQRGIPTPAMPRGP